MPDLIFVAVVVGFFIASGLTSASAKGCRWTMENIVVGVIALLLFAYLFAAMIRPEKF